MPAVRWAGAKEAGPVRVSLGVTRDDWSYDLSCGLPIPRQTAFLYDPEIKEEKIWHGSRCLPSTTTLARDRGAVTVRTDDGSRTSYTGTIVQNESVLSQIQDPTVYPELYTLRSQIQGWRFYHEFRTDRDSPLRQSQVATETRSMASDGRDLVSSLQTIFESDRAESLREALREAFPKSTLFIVPDGGCRLRLEIKVDGIERKFEAAEFSDGTLRYLCLLGALLSPAPPELLILNEPDTNLHPELLGPLARRIAEASEHTQVVLTTHSEKLARDVGSEANVDPLRLYMENGETLIEGQGLLDRA